MVKWLMEKATGTGRSFQEAPTDLRAQPLGDGLPSPADTSWEEPCNKKGHSSRCSCSLSVSCCFVIPSTPRTMTRPGDCHWWLVMKSISFQQKDEWQIGTVTGTRDTGRSYEIMTGEGTSLTGSHLKPRSFDIPIILHYFKYRTSTPSQSEIRRNIISRLQHPPKVKYFYNNQNISFQDHYKQHPPKVKYFETVPNLVIRHIGDTAYDSYISETLVPLNSAIKPKKQTRFAGDPVTSVNTIPARRTRSHPPKWTIKAGDPDMLIPKELSQARSDVNLNQVICQWWAINLRRPSQQYHWANSKLKGVTAPPQIALLISPLTQSQSEIFSDHNNSSTINENIVAPRTSTSSQREIFSETGTGTSSSEYMTHSDKDMSEEPIDPTGSEPINEEAGNSSSYSRTITYSQGEIFSSYNNCSHCSTSSPSQSEMFSDYDANSESSSRETSRPSSPEPGNLRTRTLDSPLPEMAIVQSHAQCHSHSQRTTRQGSDSSLLNQKESPSSQQTSV